MPSRKKAKGKARKAAKEKSRAGQVEVAAGQRQVGSLEAQMQGLQINQFIDVGCKHGRPLLSNSDAKIFVEFIETFIDEFTSRDVVGGLVAAQQITEEKFPSMYSSKLEAVISMLLASGTLMILEGRNDIAKLNAMLVFYFEDYLAVEVRKTKGAASSKLLELESADDHTLVSYYRKRISCSCLDEKYKEVKSIKKMGRCYNPNCSHPGGKVERSKMFSCTRCGVANYCSVECQRADWKEHKMYCNKTAKEKTPFYT